MLSLKEKELNGWYIEIGFCSGNERDFLLEAHNQNLVLL